VNLAEPGTRELARAEFPWRVPSAVSSDSLSTARAGDEPREA